MTKQGSGVRLIASEGVLRPDEAAAAPYAYIPVEVPSGAAGLCVRLDHTDPGPTDRRGIGNIVDLGLFGPGPLGLGSPAFRGWSGSERAEIVVGERVATPGYLPGPIEPGTWHVVLGLCQVAPAGCAFRVEAEPLDHADRRLVRLEAKRATFDPIGSRAAGESAPGRPSTLDQRAEPWWPGDLHCQTLHSDGRLSVAAIAAFARAGGLSFLFVSDHNTTSHRAELVAAGAAAGIAVHPAEEVTTYAGHMGALGAPGWVDFRHVQAGTLRSAAANVRQAGGLTIRNHPASTSSGWTFGPEVTDAVEVWNGPWDGRNRNDLALAEWAQELAAGRRSVAVGGSDMHDVQPDRQPIGRPITWVRASDPGLHPILEGLRSGRVVVTDTIDGPWPELRVRLALTDRPGAVPARAADVGGSLAVPPDVAVVAEWRVTAGSDPLDGTELRLIGPDRPLATIRLSSRIAEGRFWLEAGRRPALVRGELRAADDRLLALLNPIQLVEER